MAAKHINYEDLVKWVVNYHDTAIGRETKNVVISLDDITKLVDHCKTHPKSDSITSIRFYLVRQNEFSREIVFNGHSQISLVGVPVLNYKDNEHDADGKLKPHNGGSDLKEGEEIFAIYPLSEEHEHSGLCPYNCRGSINDSTTIITPE